MLIIAWIVAGWLLALVWFVTARAHATTRPRPRPKPTHWPRVSESRRRVSA